MAAIAWGYTMGINVNENRVNIASHERQLDRLENSLNEFRSERAKQHIELMGKLTELKQSLAARRAGG